LSDSVPVLCSVTIQALIDRVQKNSGFLKKPSPLGFWILLFWGFIGFSDFFYLNKQLGNLLVDLAHQLSFYLDLPALHSLLFIGY